MHNISRRIFMKTAVAVSAPALLPGCSTMEPGRISFKKQKGIVKISSSTVVSMKKNSKPQIADVYILENKIIKINEAGKKGPDVVRTIDGTGKYLIPALIDSHAHITQMRMMSKPVMDPLYMVSGVTSVRDMATGEAEWDNDELGSKFNDEEFEGPRVFKVAGFFDGPPGVFSWAIIPKNRNEVKRHIDKIAENKINAIKIYSYMTPEILKIIAKEAEKKGMYIAGHVPLCMTAIEAADSGINEFEHNFGMADTILNHQDISFFKNMRSFGRNWLKLKGREEEIGRLAHELKKRNIVNVPTHVVIRGLGYSNLPDLKKDPRMKYLPRYVPDSIWGTDNPMLQKWSDEDFGLCRKSIKLSGLFTKMLKEEGVTVLAGTDSPGSLAIPGFGLHDELKCLVKYAGFTNEEALASATRVPAEIIGVDDQIGTIEEGKTADLLLLDKSPIEDINATEELNTLIFNGKVADRKDLDNQLKALEEKFNSFLYTGMLNNCVKWGSNIGFSFLIPDPPGGWENQ